MLICSSEEGIPTPSYSWEKLDALPKLPHNAMQGITNKLAVGVPFCPTFAGKCHTHSAAQTQQQSHHHHRHLSCARPKLLSAHPPTDPAVGWWWMDEVKLWMSASGMCLCKCFVVFFNVLPRSLMLNTNSFPLTPNTCFLLVQSLWPLTLLLTVGGITGVGVLGLVFSIRDQWCSRLSFLFQSVCLYTTGQ